MEKQREDFKSSINRRDYCGQRMKESHKLGYVASRRESSRLLWLTLAHASLLSGLVHCSHTVMVTPALTEFFTDTRHCAKEKLITHMHTHTHIHTHNFVVYKYIKLCF